MDKTKLTSSFVRFFFVTATSISSISSISSVPISASVEWSLVGILIVGWFEDGWYIAVCVGWNVWKDVKATAEGKKKRQVIKNDILGIVVVKEGGEN